MLEQIKFGRNDTEKTPIARIHGENIWRLISVWNVQM